MLSDQKVRLIFGLKLKQLRHDRNLSLKELAEVCGISVSYLNEIEKGKKYPKSEKIVALAHALEVPYDEMVSLKLGKTLAPVNELLNSEILNELPLDVFGVNLENLVEIISNAPIKVSAFISTLISIARNYEMRVELFLHATLRSYQELHDNYFEELEEAAERFTTEFGLPVTHAPIPVERLKELLKGQYNYQIDEAQLGKYTELQDIRSVFVQKKSGNKLLLNLHLTEAQAAFQLAKEIGYNYLHLTERSNTQSWVRAETFEQVLNNFKASYFAGALFLNRTRIQQDFKNFIASETWSGAVLLQLIEQYNVSTDTFLYRLTSIAPRFLGLNELFFMRMSYDKTSEHFDVTKELHLPNLHNPHSNEINEHYCRRWVGVAILTELNKHSQNGNPPADLVVKAQRALYLSSGKEYFCISIARNPHATQSAISSVTIGFLINKDFMNKVRFWNDMNVPVVLVSATCERCKLNDCKERSAPPYVLEKQVRQSRMEARLKEVIAQTQ
ncbi:XRE family transcriptional regulator [Sphingobacteriales bacterium UPWRP_1]|nr:hypothetical protein B6N25_04705 [Sphingobacteriales bacterium TSM_CSS]PSJ78261.1 XRE family transcriptional regulator [Sphingobacteriales bacterium UPWRP_1]